MSEASERYLRLADLFGRARALAADERPAFLARECGDDPELQREVLAMLAADEDPAGPFDEARIAAGRERLEGVVDAAQGSWGVPERIGSYRLLRCIGSGGMAVVYEAEQVSPRRRVALKLLHPGLSRPEHVARFRLEAEALGRLQHPCIAQVHEAGAFDCGRGEQPYIAMELIDGRSLTEHAAELEPDERIALFCRVCDGVAHAHERGIVHRDLKPENILVTSDGQPKVLDFGIARALDRSVAATLLTSVGEVLGTVLYMSPEQAGGGTEVDTRADVFSLGVVLFELLTGERPVKTEGLTLSQALHVIARGDHALGVQGHPLLRGDLETILGKALAGEPGRRYADAGQLAADLRRHLADEPIVARPPSITYRLRKFTRRNRALVASTLVVFLSLVLGLGLALRQARRASAGERRANANAAEAQRQAYRATMVAVAGEIDAGRLLEAAAELDQIPAAQSGWEADHFRAVIDEAFGRVVSQAPSLGALIAEDGSAAYTASLEGERAELLRVSLAGGARVERFPLDARPLAVPREALALAIRGLILRHPDGVELDVVDAGSGELLRRIRTCPCAVEAAADLAAVVRVAGDATLALVPTEAGVQTCDLSTGRLIGPGVGGLVTELSPDASRLLVARNAEALVRRTDTWTEEWRSPRGTDGTSAAAFAPDGDVVFTAGLITDPMLRKWSLEAGLLAERPLEGCVGAEAWAFAPAGESLAIAPSHRWIHVFDSDLEQELARLALPPCGRVDLALSSGGTRLVAALGPLGLRAWDLQQPRARGVLGGHQRYVYTVAFSPDGELLASGSWDKSVRLWDVRAQRPVAVLEGFTERHIQQLAWSSDGTRLYVASGQAVIVLDARTGREEARADLGSPVASLALRPPGGELVAVVETGLRALDPRTLADTRPLPGLRYAAWSPDGSRLATGTGNARLVVLDGDDLEELWRTGASVPSGVARVAWSPDGGRIACRTQGDGVVILDGADGSHRARMEVEPMCLAWSGDGRRIAAGSGYSEIVLLDTESGRQIVTLLGHRAYVAEVAFSPDGRTLASASGDGDVRLWRAASR